MSSKLDALITLGNDITAIKYYAVGTGAILFYDYLLTLGDEIKYAWSGKKTWIFWLFLVNRYFPMTYQLWQFALVASPQSNLASKICERASWYPLFMFNICTLLAQVVLTLRMYAVTMRSISVAVVFAVITIGQFVFGVYDLAVVAISGKTLPLPQIPLDPYHICVFVQPGSLGVWHQGISLFYDFLAFSVILFLVMRMKMQGIGMQAILRTIAEDATRYFFVIFTSHFVVVMTMTLGRKSIELLPAPGNVVFLPVMVSRITLSLKKAADSERNVWSAGESATNGIGLQTIKFFRPPRGITSGEGDISLSTRTEV